MHTVHKARVTTPTEVIQPAVVEIDATGANVRAKNGELLVRLEGEAQLLSHNHWQIGDSQVKVGTGCGCGPTSRKTR